MTRVLLIFAIFCLTALASGCRLCCAPFDYCGPKCDGSCGGCCGDIREGSILSETSYQTPYAEEEVPGSYEESYDAAPQPSLSPVPEASPTTSGGRGRQITRRR